MIHIPKMYISPPCARRAHRNPSTYIHPPSVGMIYPIPSYIFKSYIFQKCTFPHPVPEGHTETHQLKYIPQVLAWYIQYQGIYSTDLYFPNCWYHIWILVYHSNLHIYPKKLQHLYNTYIYCLQVLYTKCIQKYNICGSMFFEAVFVSFCICVFVYLQF
jgi:hypothetical protein